jgi:hypothetical protein
VFFGDDFALFGSGSSGLRSKKEEKEELRRRLGKEIDSKESKTTGWLKAQILATMIVK